MTVLCIAINGLYPVDHLGDFSVYGDIYLQPFHDLSNSLKTHDVRCHHYTQQNTGTLFYQGVTLRVWLLYPVMQSALAANHVWCKYYTGYLFVSP